MSAKKEVRASTESVLSLFLRSVDKKDLPVRDSEEFRRRMEATKTLEERTQKAQHDKEEKEAPLYNGALKLLGVDPQDYIGILKATASADSDLQPAIGKGFTDCGPLEAVPMQYEKELQPELPELAAEGLVGARGCVSIDVTVCPVRVCVSNPMPMSVDDIWLETGSDGSFTKLGPNSFRANDYANGWSTWNLTYHRHSRTHGGRIIVSGSTELVEPARVTGMGMKFQELPGSQNGGCAFGKVNMWTPNSWGHVKLWRRIELRYKRPSEAWTNWLMSADILYHDLWNEQGSYVPGGCGPLGLHNVLGGYGYFDFHVLRNAAFPAATQFLMEVILEWWVKGNGEGGGAGAFYGMSVHPYIDIEACSMQLPETITIHVPDYVGS